MSQNGLARYSPQHPLPEELKKMKRDETVCKYCGVSYLIHSEIKALEDRLRKTEEELKHYKGSLEREAALKEDVARYAATVETYRRTIEDRDNVIKNVTCEIESKNGTILDLRRTKQVLEDKLVEEITQNDSYRSKLDNFKSTLPTIQSVLRQFREEMSQVRTDVQNVKRTSSDDLKELMKKQTGVFDSVVKEQSKLRHDNMALISDNSRLLKFEREFEDGAKSWKETEAKLAELKQSHDKLLNVEKRNQQEIAELKHCLENEKAGKRLSQSEAQQYREQLRPKRKKGLFRVYTAFFLGAKNKELETVLANKLNNEKGMETSVLVLQEKLKKKDHTYKELTIECERLRRDSSQRQDQQNQLEAEIRRKASASKHEVNDLKESLMKAEEELFLLKSERENTIRSHQNQIEDLRDSFKKKLFDAEHWQEKVDEALRDERLKHGTEVETLEKRLRSEFETESQIEKQRHQELTEKYQRNLKEAETKYKSELAQLVASHKSELGDLHRQISESRQRQKDQELRLKSEINGLKTCIKELEERLARLGAGNEDSMAELRNNCREKDNAISLLKSEVSILEKRIQELTEQMSHLQDTVRRECEERFELMEALGTAKEELLTLKRPSGGYTSPSPRLSLVHNDQRRHSLNSLNQSQASFQRPPPIREAFTANEAVIGGDVNNQRVEKMSSTNQTKGGTVTDGRKRIAAAIDSSVDMPDEIDLSKLRGRGLQPGEVQLPQGPPEPVVQLNESYITQLMEMGFPVEACRKAVYHTDNTGVEEAMNWLVQHMDDPDFSAPFEPPPKKKTKTDVTVNQENVMMIVNMGFTAQQAAMALRKTDDNLERAVDYMFSHADELENEVMMEEAGSARPDAKCRDGSGRYRLLAFISHMGTSSMVGHYVCHIKREGQWVIFNDEKVSVSERPPKDLGYLYLYERV